MPYSPPSSPLNVSWTGAPAYGGASGIIRGSWDTTGIQYLYPPGAAPGGFGAPATALKQAVVSPTGISSGDFGETYLRRYPYLYRPPQATLNASWVGALPYAAPRGTVPVTFDPSKRYVGPGGIAPGSAGTPLLIQQQFARPGGILSQAFGAATYVLRRYEYKPPQWVINASWVGADPYTRPIGTINAAFTPPAEDTIVAGVGWDSALYGTPTIINGSRQLVATGIPSAEAFGGANVFLKERFLRPSGFAGEGYGTTFVSHRNRQLLPAGIVGAIGTHTVINTRATQRAFPPSIVSALYGTPNVSPRILYVTGIFGAFGTPFVTRNPSPLGIDSAAYGVPTIEYRTKVLQPAGIVPGVAGQPEIADRAQHVANVGVVQTVLFGDHAVRNTRQIVAVPGDDQSFVSLGTDVSNRDRQLLPAAIPPGLVAGPFQTEDPLDVSTLNYAQIIQHLNDGDTWTYFMKSVKNTASQQDWVFPPTTDSQFWASAVISNDQYIALLTNSWTYSRMQVYEKATGAWEATVLRVSVPGGGYLYFTDRHGHAKQTDLNQANGAGEGLALMDEGGIAMRVGAENVIWRPGRVFSTAYGSDNYHRADGGKWSVQSGAGGVSIAKLVAGTDTYTITHWLSTASFSIYGAAIDGDYLYALGSWDYLTAGLLKIDLNTGTLVASIDSTTLAAGWPVGSVTETQLAISNGKLFVTNLACMRVFDLSLNEIRVPRFTHLTLPPPKYAGLNYQIVAYNGYVAVGARTRTLESYLDGRQATVESNEVVVFRGSDGKLHRPLGVRALTNVWNYSPNVTPVGIDSLQMGLASETGVGARHRQVYPVGFGAPLFGTAKLTRTPSLEPAGIAPPAFGAALVAPRIRAVLAQGRADSVFGQPTLWDRVRYVRDAGQQDLALYGTPRVESTIRYLTEVTARDTSSFGQGTLWYRVRSLTLGGIGFDIGKQFGGAKVQDARQTISGAGTQSREIFGNLGIARNERLLRPAGFIGEVGSPAVDWKRRYLQHRSTEDSSYGTPALYNARQYVLGYSPADEAGYGRPDVANRNRVIRTYGADISKFTSATLVENKARVLLGQGFVGTAGVPMVSARVRYVAPQGHEDSRFSVWASVYNSMRRLEPSGIGRGLVGVPRVWDNTQRIDTADGGVDNSLWGTAFVAYRLRTLDVDRFGVAPPAWPDPYIGLYSRPVAPPSMLGGMGVPTVEETRNIIAMLGQEMTRWGSPAVRNKTPQLYVGSMDPPANPQRHYIGFRVRPAEIQGFEASLYGRPDVQMRTRYITPNGVLTQRFGVQWVKFDAPQIPPQQTIDVTGEGRDFSVVPSPVMNLRGMIVEGIFATRFGAPTLRTNVIAPISVPFTPSDQVGEPSLNGTQYIDLAGEYGIRPGEVPSPVLWPYILRISENASGVTVRVEALMDYPDLPRPKFGSTTVQLKNRRISTYSTGDAKFGAMGVPAVDFRLRYLRPVGIAPRRFGIPQVPSNWEIRPFWGRDIPQDLPGVSYDTAKYGHPTLTAPTPYDPNVRPQGSSMTQWGKASVDLFIRVVRPSGSANFQPGTPWVHPPVRLLPQGFAEQWGLPWVSHKHRTLPVEGFDASRFGYDPGSWWFPSMTVRHRAKPTLTGIAPPIIAGPAVRNAQLGTIATLGDTSAVGKPRVGACTC